MKVKKRIWEIIKFSWTNINKQEKKKVIKRIIVGTLIGYMDIITLINVSILITLLSFGASNIKESNTSNEIINYLVVQFQFNQIILMISFLIVILLLVKSLLGILNLKLLYNDLNTMSVRVSKSLLTDVFNSELHQISNRSKEEISFASKTGVDATVVVAISSIYTFSIDLIIIISFLILISFIEIWVVIGLIIIFILFTIIIRFNVFNKQIKLSHQDVESNIRTLETISERIASIDFIKISNKKNRHIDFIMKYRKKASDIFSKKMFYEQVPKYIFEIITLIIIVMIILISVFYTEDMQKSIQLISFVIFTLVRITPNVLRIQSSISSIQNWSSYIQNFMEIKRHFSVNNQIEIREIIKTDSILKISCKDLCLTDKDGNLEILKNINFDFEGPGLIAILGPSGSGKSSLLKLLMGLNNPTSGEIRLQINNKNQNEKSKNSSLSYVPQRIEILNGTLQDNIAVGLESSDINSELVRDLMVNVDLEDVHETYSNLHDDQKSKYLLNLSGGERQKLGIARAIICRPEFLGIDEPTSALDSKSKYEILDIIRELKKKSIVIMVTHDLTLIENDDYIINMVNGAIKSQGKLKDVSDEIRIKEK